LKPFAQIYGRYFQLKVGLVASIFLIVDFTD
jgi:hypothetical protein